MALINYISKIAIPFVIFYVVTYGFIMRIKVFDSFLAGCQEGISTVIKIFPTLIGLFLAVSALRNSGILDLISTFLSPILNLFKIPSAVLPLMLVRPISGSASTAVALDIMKNYGVDSIIGSIASTIMGCTETTLYTIAIYVSACRNQENTFCSYCCSYCRYHSECYRLSFFVKFCRKVFLDFCQFLRYYSISFYLINFKSVKGFVTFLKFVFVKFRLQILPIYY